MGTVTFEATYHVWRVAVDMMLRLWCGRPLADAPVPEAWLVIWWRAGVPARIVAQALTTRMPKTRATFSRYYTDRRPRDVAVALASEVRA